MEASNKGQVDLLQKAATDILGADGVKGLVIAAQITFIYMDEVGDERIHGMYFGGLMNALGLATQHVGLLLDES